MPYTERPEPVIGADPLGNGETFYVSPDVNCGAVSRHGDLSVYVFADVRFDDDPVDHSEASIGIHTTDGKYINVDDPEVAQRLGEELLAAAPVLARLKNGTTS